MSHHDTMAKSGFGDTRAESKRMPEDTLVATALRPCSKNVENHAAAVALYFMYSNFGRAHQTLRVAPAMEGGATTHIWSVEVIVGWLG
jgi:hypothetical protein